MEQQSNNAQAPDDDEVDNQQIQQILQQPVQAPVQQPQLPAGRPPLSGRASRRNSVGAASNRSFQSFGSHNNVAGQMQQFRPELAGSNATM